MMNKDEFLRQLEELLSDIPEEERHDAIEYYRDYFEDATKDEEKILEELGSPLIVAENIRKGIFEDYSKQTVKNQIQKYECNDKKDSKCKKSNDNNNTVIIIVSIIAILTSPLWFGILTGFISILFSIAICLIVIVFVTLIIGIVGFISGIASIGAGIGSIVNGLWMTGFNYIGIGCICISLGLIFMVLCSQYSLRFLPWLFKEIVHLFKRLFHKEEKQI